MDRMPHTIHIHIVNGNDFRVNCGSTATCIAPDLILLVLCQRTIVRFITGAIVFQPFLAYLHEVIALPHYLVMAEFHIVIGDVVDQLFGSEVFGVLAHGYQLP